MARGPGYDGLLTYLRAKERFANSRRELIEHHAIVPGSEEFHFGGWHELAASTRTRQGAMKLTSRSQPLCELICELQADVLVLHGPLRSAQRVVEVARSVGVSRVVGVVHRQAPAGAASWTTPQLWWKHRQELRAVSHVDELATPVPANALTRSAVRLGVDPEFHPGWQSERGQDVVFVGEIAAETQVNRLLFAAYQPDVTWRVRIVGEGSGLRAARRAIKVFGLSHRVTIEPPVTDRSALAELLAGAGCVVNPGPPHRCQLVTLEAAATGTSVVLPMGAPLTAIAPGLTHTFRSDVMSLVAAINQALSARPHPDLGARVAHENAWHRAFEGELEYVYSLVRS